MSDDYREYKPHLSKCSSYLELMRLPVHGYLWFILVGVSAIDMARRRGMTIRAVLILALLVASYLQCISVVILYIMERDMGESWRHLSVCDSYFVFSVITALGILIRCPRERSYIDRKIGMIFPQNRLLSWMLIIIAIIVFGITIYAPYKFRPTPAHLVEPFIVNSQDPRDMSPI